MSTAQNTASANRVETEPTVEIEEGAFSVPESIKNSECWITFRLEERKDGKMAKVPKNPSTPRRIYNCDPTDPENGVSFEEAMDAVDVSQDVRGDDGFDGVGLQLDGTPLTGIDLDDVVQDGEIEEWAHSMIEDFASFSEVSPSGTGAHILVEGELDPEYSNKNDAIGIEMYDTERFFTFTGRHIDGTPETIEDAPHGLLSAYQSKYMDESNTEDDGSSGSTGGASSDAQWADVDVDGHCGLMDYDDLTEREQKVIDAGWARDDEFKMLYSDAESAWSHDTKWDGGNESSCDMGLISNLYFWGVEADMFGFELTLEEIERCFMSSEIADRKKSRTRPKYVRSSIEKKFSGEM
ncbi:hypothetical protein [Natronoglomus mannanivorans]|uniref:DNA primase/polymerase bifunctional N-terminal domain-containing protein n=1 Tax=Natronoglomus mannanivorans TaxID=2979990 RepID=A0AAP3E460_9EURY|nr:hypothetical protein [Halobacteria archaeon AArc-xg1-1]